MTVERMEVLVLMNSSFLEFSSDNTELERNMGCEASRGLQKRTILTTFNSWCA